MHEKQSLKLNQERLLICLIQLINENRRRQLETQMKPIR